LLVNFASCDLEHGLDAREAVMAWKQTGHLTVQQRRDK